VTTPQFFALPDGKTPSHVQIKIVTDATGEITKVPAEITTPQQAQEWDAIQAAAKPDQSAILAKMMARAAKPLFDAESEQDHATGVNQLDEVRANAVALAATSITVELSKPVTKAEHDQRVSAAVALATSLGLQLVQVVDDPVAKVPAHLELRQSGNPYMAGDLVMLERVLADMTRDREVRDAQIELFHQHQLRIARERAEAIAASPAGQLAALKAKLTEQGITV
jgi:hypothetical protein